MKKFIALMSLAVFSLLTVNVHAGFFDYFKKKDSPKIVERDIPNIQEKDLKTKPFLRENVQPSVSPGLRVYPNYYPTILNNSAHNYFSDKVQFGICRR